MWSLKSVFKTVVDRAGQKIGAGFHHHYYHYRRITIPQRMRPPNSPPLGWLFLKRQEARGGISRNGSVCEGMDACTAGPGS